MRYSWILGVLLVSVVSSNARADEPVGKTPKRSRECTRQNQKLTQVAAGDDKRADDGTIIPPQAQTDITLRALVTGQDFCIAQICPDNVVRFRIGQGPWQDFNGHCVSIPPTRLEDNPIFCECERPHTLNCGNGQGKCRADGWYDARD